MYCLSCGTDNPDQARFCMACSYLLAPVSDQLPQVQPAFPTSDGFVGRQRELAELHEALDVTLSGQGRLVMLVGEPGIGKTRIVQELVRVADAMGADVLWGRCYEEQGMPPFWPWVQVIRSYVREKTPEELREDLGSGAAVIAEIVSEVNEKLPDLVPPPSLDSPEQARFRLFDSISTFLKTAVQREPLVLILDDLHWADQPSLLLLQFIARELGQDRLLLLGTYRDMELSRQHPLAETLGELTRERLFQRVLLRGLSQTEVSRYIELAIGTQATASLVAAVFNQTEGNPLFMTEVVRLLIQEGGLGRLYFGDGNDSAPPATVATRDLRIPEGVREVIGRRLNRLSTDCNELLSVASVVGREFALAQLGGLFADKTEEQIIDVLEEALEARVIEELPQSVGLYQFSHALVQETLAAELNLTRRVRLHARIGLALEKLYERRIEEHAAELAYHFQAAETVTGVDKVVHYAGLAGEQALAAYAYEDALAFFRMGLVAKEIPLEGEVPAPDADAAALLFGLGRSQAATYSRLHMPEAFRVVNRAFDYYESEGAVEEAVAVAGYYLPVMTTIGSSRNVPRALALVPEDSYPAAKLLSLQGFSLGQTKGGYDQAQASFSKALAIARREKDVGLEIQTMYFSARIEWFHCHLKSSLNQFSLVNRLIRSNQLRQVEGQNLLTGSVVLGIMGDFAGSREHSTAVLDSATEVRVWTDLVSGNWAAAWVSLLEGNWPICLEHSERGLGLAADDLRILASRVLLEYHLGEVGEGEMFLQRYLAAMGAAEKTLIRGVGMAIAIAFPFASLALTISNDVNRVGPLHQLIQSIRETVGTPFGHLLFRSALGLLASLQSDSAGAREQYDQLDSARGTFAPLALSGDRLLGILATTFGDLEAAAGHFADAIEFCRQTGARTELAWACYQLGDTSMQRGASGDRSRAPELLAEALAISTELGLAPLIQRVRALLDQPTSILVSGQDYLDGLTEREVQVLRLIAAGKSNPEIGDELVISVRTVANHVANILNKTNTANRAEAASYATRYGLA